jgi:hypothetical protein
MVGETDFESDRGDRECRMAEQIASVIHSDAPNLLTDTPTIAITEPSFEG